ncbi:MAG: hypothetical protein ACRD3A_10790, partial [Terriglobales bacterium]
MHYHHQAAETAVRRSANVEAIAHLSRGLELLETLPDTPERSRREIQLQLAPAGRLMVAHSPTAPEVESAYLRARELCQQTEDTAQLFFALRGLWEVYFVRAELPETRALAEQLLGVARRGQDPLSLSEAYRALGTSLLWLGEVGPAQQLFSDSLALVDPRRDHSYAFLNALDPRVSRLSSWSLALCHQGYPAQALQKGEAALDLARELGDPFSSAFALYFLARLHQTRGEGQPAGARTEALVALATEHGLPLWMAAGTLLQGRGLVEQGQAEEGLAMMHQGLAAWRAMGPRLEESYFLALLAEAYGKVGQAAEGLAVVAEALAVVDKNGERVYEAELYRLKGELSLQSRSSESGARNQEAKSQAQSAKVSGPRPLIPDPQAEAEAEECFHQAIAI